MISWPNVSSVVPDEAILPRRRYNYYYVHCFGKYVGGRFIEEVHTSQLTIEGIGIMPMILTVVFVAHIIPNQMTITDGGSR